MGKKKTDKQDFFDTIDLVSRKLKKAKTAAVGKAVKSLGVQFPFGYEDYVCRLGHGEYNGLVCVMMPQAVVTQTEEARDRWDEYFFWDKAKRVLPRQKVLQSVVLAESAEGDEFIFHPERPDVIYVLERGGDHIYKAGTSLPEALRWFFTSGKLADKTKEHSFRPCTGSTTEIYRRPPGDGPFPTDMAERIKALGLHDRVRRDVDDPKGRHPRTTTTFAVKVLGGEAICEDGDYGQVMLTHEEGCRAPALKSLLAVLREAGLCTPSGPQECVGGLRRSVGGDWEELFDPTDEDLTENEGRKDLVALELSWASNVTDEGLTALAKLPNLARLRVADAKLISDQGLKHIARCKQLRYLELESPNISDAGLAALSALKKLDTLVVRPPFPCRLKRVSGSCLAELSKLRKLTNLHFLRSDIKDDALAHVAKMKQLERLSLPGAKLTAKGVGRLAPLVNLRHLMLPDKVAERAKTELQRQNPRLCIHFSDDSMTW